ncbi:membrane protein insertase YidC [Enterococcus gallinarum]|uniref:membrane protein insertase YidC n=1 Tax=Enterococcus gallinarum TaxID=1353 RepID=UPI0024334CE6|nr:membrane protein insertase YidC [Enterococcus gallinarum]
MSKMNKWLLSSGLLGLLLTLSGCVSTNSDGTPNENGMIYRFLVKPLGNLITMLVENFDWSYGWAIIAVTIVVRLIILPLGIHQSKKTMIQSEKMQFLKPQVDIAQANLKKATTREEQMQAQADMQKIYSENNVSMFGGIGCLPLLIQMPIFSALYFTARYTQGIQNSEFFGISLGQPSFLFVAIAGISYLIQGYISTIGIPEEQKKTMKTMLIVSPLMIVFMSLSAPAGVTLYWVVGGVFSCLQTFITNVIMKPKIRAQVEAEMKANPPKTVVTPRKDVTPTQQMQPTTPKNLNHKNAKGRNAGKQQRK